MSSTSKHPKQSLRRRRRRAALRRRPHARACRTRRSSVNGGRTCSNVSHKLEALKNIIPRNGGEIVKPDQLFQETADYIMLLKTQVVILQTLIEFCGSSAAVDEKQENAVL